MKALSSMKKVLGVGLHRRWNSLLCEGPA